MPFVHWKGEDPFKKDGLPVGTEQFWIGVRRAVKKSSRKCGIALSW